MGKFHLAGVINYSSSSCVLGAVGLAVVLVPPSRTAPKPTVVPLGTLGLGQVAQVIKTPQRSLRTGFFSFSLIAILNLRLDILSSPGVLKYIKHAK